MTDISDFAEFANALRGHRLRSEGIVRVALRGAGDAGNGPTSTDLGTASRAIDEAFRDLDNAAEELRLQNEALFEARTDLEATGAMFRDFFEYAPSAYLVTTIETQVTYANEAACALFRLPKNALARKPVACFVPVERRPEFRVAIIRTVQAGRSRPGPLGFSRGIVRDRLSRSHPPGRRSWGGRRSARDVLECHRGDR